MNANQEYAIIGGAGGSDQTTTMPTPSAENLGTIVQYVGDTNQYYTNGYFYKVVSNGEVPPTYSREQVDTQPASSGEEHEFITQADYDNLTPAQKAEKVYMIKESGTPSTVLTAGAGIDISNDEISADMSTAVYDNTTSGLTATTVQDAIDEVNENIDNLKNSTVINTSDTTAPTLSGLTYTLNADGVYAVDISNGHRLGVYIYLYLNGEMIGSVNGHTGGLKNTRLKATIFDGRVGDTISLNYDPTGETSGSWSVTKINRIYSVVSDF